MFEFDLNTNQSPVSIHGEPLRNTIAMFVGQENKSCWLQIHDEVPASNAKPLSAKTSYQSYCVGHLSAQGAVVMRNYNDQGVQTTDPILGLLNNLVLQLNKLQREELRDFMSEISVRIPRGVLPNYSRFFCRAIEIQGGGREARKMLANEVLILIQIYCENIGPLVIDVGNTDSFSGEHKTFLANLATQVPTKLCLVSTTLAKEEMSLPEATIFHADVHSIVKRIMKKLIRVHFNLDHASEKKLTKLILNDYRASNVAQATAIIKNIFEMCNASSSGQQQDDDKLSNVNFTLIEQHYLLPSKLKRTASITSIEEAPEKTLEEKRVRVLCSILGPYIKFDNLKKIYSYCFNGNAFPTAIDYSKMSLVNIGGLIRYEDLDAYDAALQQQKTDKHTLIVGAINIKIRSAIVEGEMRDHLDTLYERRNGLSNVMEMRIQKTIIKLYGLNIDRNQNIDEHGLSSSSDRVVGKVSVVKPSFTTKDLELIIHCFNELICYYCAKQDLHSAFNYCHIIAEFLDNFHADDYEVNMTDIDLIGMISLNKSRSSGKKQKPYGKLDPSLHDPVISILSNLCMVSYFLGKYLSMRKYIGYAYLIQNESSEHKSVIDACIALILTQSAERQLRTCINAELDCPIPNPSLPDLELELYHQMRKSASILISSARAQLEAKPLLPEQALAACMFVIAGNHTFTYDDLRNFLRTAYENGIKQEAYFKAILAFGNSILFEVCCGVVPTTLKSSCEAFLKECDHYGINLPKSIIQGFLDFANYSNDPSASTKNFDLTVSTEPPNNLFINISRLKILFSMGYYSACVDFIEKMRQLQSTPVQDNTHDGYNILKILDLIEAVALLRYLEENPEQKTEARVRLIRFNEKLFKQYAAEFPQNYACDYAFLIAEISRSELSKEIIDRDRLSVDEQLDCYDKAVDYANERGNIEFSKAITKIARQIRKNKTSTNVPVAQQPTSATVTADVPSENGAKKVYDDQLQELVQRTKSDIVILFIHNPKNGKYLPKLVYCDSGNATEVGSFFSDEISLMNHQPESLSWHHPAVQKSVNEKKLIYYPANDCEKIPFLLVEQIKSVMAIPITNHGKIVSVLYLHGNVSRDFTKVQLKIFEKFAHTFFEAVDANPKVLALARLGNRKAVSSKSSANKSSRTANTSESTSTNASTTTSESALTASGSPALFSPSVRLGGSGSTEERQAASSKLASTNDNDDDDLVFDDEDRPTLTRSRPNSLLKVKLNYTFSND